jgi:hypothetical protein
VRERYRSFNNDPTLTIAVVGNSSGRDYEVDAQLMIAERNLPLPTDLEPQRFKGLNIKDVMREHYPAFTVEASKLTGKKKRNIGHGLFTNESLTAGDVTTLFAWGVVHSTEITKVNPHPSASSSVHHLCPDCCCVAAQTIPFDTSTTAGVLVTSPTWCSWSVRSPARGSFTSTD